MTAHPARLRARPPRLDPQLIVPYVGNWTVISNGALEPGVQSLGIVGQRPLITVTGDDKLPKLLASELTPAEIAAGKSTLQSSVSYNTGNYGGVPTRYGRTHIMRTTIPILPATLNDPRFTFQRIADGAYDLIWIDAGNQIRTNWPNGAIVALGWEISANWYPWGFQHPQNNYPGVIAAYQAAHRRIVGILRARAPRVRIEWNFVLTSSHPPQGRLEEYYPGDDWVDLLGYQAYAEKWRSTESQMRSGVAQNRSSAIGWNWARDFALGVNVSSSIRSGKKPMMIGEWGVWDYDNPFHMEGFFDWMAELGQNGVLAGHSYFDVAAHKLSQYPRSLEVYRRRVGELIRSSNLLSFD